MCRGSLDEGLVLCAVFDTRRLTKMFGFSLSRYGVRLRGLAGVESQISLCIAYNLHVAHKHYPTQVFSCVTHAWFNELGSFWTQHVSSKASRAVYIFRAREDPTS